MYKHGDDERITFLPEHVTIQCSLVYGVIYVHKTEHPVDVAMSRDGRGTHIMQNGSCKTGRLSVSKKYQEATTASKAACRSDAKAACRFDCLNESFVQHRCNPLSGMLL